MQGITRPPFTTQESEASVSNDSSVDELLTYDSSDDELLNLEIALQEGYDEAVEVQNQRSQNKWNNIISNIL